MKTRPRAKMNKKKHKKSDALIRTELHILYIKLYKITGDIRS